MRRRILTIFIIILAFFIGAGSMYLLIQYFPMARETINKITKTSETTIKIEETATEDAVTKAYDAVVVVESMKGEEEIASGTGFVYKKDSKYGYIITNNHVISEGTSFNVIFSNGEKVAAKLLGKDSYADIAVLSVSQAKVIKVAEIGSTSSLKLGNTVFAIGAPISTDYRGTVTKGIISGKDRYVAVSTTGTLSNDWLVRVIQTDAAINPGNSGGPLLNLAGQVIGINSLKLVDENIEGIGFAIPIEDAMQYVSRLEKGEVIARPVLGVELYDTDETYSLFYENINLNKSIKSGAVVVSVDKDSAAEKAGLQKGDVIQKIGNIVVENKAELRYELYKYDVGAKIKLTYYRNNKSTEIEVTLGGNKE